jgi:uncharacterized repeat protein (TIGR02543 family)
MRKSIYAITAVLLLLAAVGCDTTTGSGTEPGAGQGQDGLAVVSLAIAGTTGGRSVLPAHAELQDVAKWRLLGGKTGETRKPLTALFSDPDAQTLHLATGDWDFTLEGYADESGETLILRETIKGRRITLEGPNTLSFVVEPVSEGTGTVEIAIELPEGHGINRVEVFKDGKKLELEPPLLPDAQNNIVFEQADHEAGDYYYSFRLFKGDDLYGVVSELVQVRMNLRSKATPKLGEEDLNLSYVIDYHLDVNEPDLDYYRRTDAAPALAEPDDRKGYEFDGWHTDVDLKDEPVTKLPTPVTGGNRDFYAQWEPTAYPIFYKPDDQGIDYGDNPATYTIADAITLEDPERDGFRFVGWHRDELCQDPIIEAPEIPGGSTGDQTFYTEWIRQYTIAFETHGGFGDGSFTYDVGTPVDRPEDPTWGQSQFIGWFNEEGNMKYDDWPYTLTGDITMHAQWNHLVTFEPNGGSPAPASIFVPGGGTVEAPAPMTKLPVAPGLYTDTVAFGGWYNNPAHEEPEYAFGAPVAEPLNLYAKWTEPSELSSGQTGDHVLAKALAYIENDASGATNYTIVLDGNSEMAATTTINKANAVITLVGKGPTEISLAVSGTLFELQAGELVLDNNITLKGRSGNNASLVSVAGASSSLTMKAGAKITGNETNVSGSAVYIGAGGSFTMEGGEISGNFTSIGGFGGSVAVSGGAFTMRGGKISGNSHSDDNATSGVLVVEGGSFIMEGGEISGNWGTNNGRGRGGGVFIYYPGCSFSKTKGVITDNTALTAYGRAVFYVVNPSSPLPYGTTYYRDTPLNDGDEISTDKLPSSGTGFNWTKK